MTENSQSNTWETSSSTAQIAQLWQNTQSNRATEYIKCNNTMALMKIPQCTRNVVCKATENSLHNNFNREDSEDGTAILKPQIPLQDQ
jgi:hypothetical protein